MQFVAKKEDLLKELSLVQGVVEKRTTRPILSNAMLESDGSGVAVYATDLEVGLSSHFKAEVGRSGAITVPAKKFTDIVRSLPEGSQVNVELKENNFVAVTCGKIKFKLAGAPKEDYPAVPKPADEKTVEIPAGLLKMMIAQTIYSITVEETRYALNGAQLAFGDGNIRMVTTDAHRLSIVEHAFEGYTDEVKEILVPRKTVQELRTLIDDRLDSVFFTQTENHLFFRIGDRILDSRTLEGQFPNYQKVLPKDNDQKVMVEKALFESAIGRVALLSNETSRAIRLNFTPDYMIISSSNPEMGEAKEEIPIEYDGPELAIGFNSKYLADFIGTVNSDRLIINLRDESAAGLLEPEGTDQGMYRYVIMPMRI